MGIKEIDKEVFIVNDGDDNRDMAFWREEEEGFVKEHVWDRTKIFLSYHGN